MDPRTAVRTRPVIPRPSARRSPAAAASEPSTPATVNVTETMIAASRRLRRLAQATGELDHLDGREEAEDETPQDGRQPDRAQEELDIGGAGPATQPAGERRAEEERHRADPDKPSAGQSRGSMACMLS
jgi:hypothetical protein